MITVLRLGHRPARDKRLTTHVCLTARALGARRVLLDEEDPRVEATVRDVVARFGGPLEIASGVPWKRALREHREAGGTSVHLTMYGERLQDVLPDLQEAGVGPGEDDADLLVVVGAEKVPGDVYGLVDRNVSVGNQPHSEVAALAILLYALQGPKALERAYEDARVVVEPTARGKTVVDPTARARDAGEP